MASLKELRNLDPLHVGFWIGYSVVAGLAINEWRKPEVRKAVKADFAYTKQKAKNLLKRSRRS